MDPSEVVWYDNRGNYFTLSELKKIFSDRMKKQKQKLFIGTDSHRGRKARSVAVATTICAWNDEYSKGGWYCFNRVHVPKKRFGSLYERLFHEAQKSVEIACILRDEMGLNIEEVHIDVNPKESEASNKYATMLKSYVEAFGFLCVMKPESWAASSVADKHAR
jgi:predicted RNase H-related nuclease YkuK (DUF458 family)